MIRFVIVVGLCAGVVLVAGQAHAQYRYTDDKGVSRVTQYKLDVPARHRDAAVWVGPTGVGKPALSEEQRETKRRWDAYRRIGESSLKPASFRRLDAVHPEKCRER
ncbi:MAG TPA: hypothetical protein VL086_02375 [Candidatus Nitrosotalea sp.]|nr:hypothetical protein [Candidatus Nitrosotalea sp.]